MPKPAYRRVIVKLSGEALGGAAGAGLDQATLQRIAADLVAAQKLGVTVGVVVGGGNFMRGAQATGTDLPRETGDAMGMLATVINALALEAAIVAAGGAARTLSALAMPQVCESYSRQRALKQLAAGHIVIFAGGTGNPYFTTDTTAVLRAAEMGCDAVLKATNVDGVYSADPKNRPEGDALRSAHPQGRHRPESEGHGRHGLCACPRKSYAYHRVFNPGGRRRDVRVARDRARDDGQ